MELALFARNVRFSAAPLSSCVFCGKIEEEIEDGEEFGEEPASGGRQRRSRLSRVISDSAPIWIACAVPFLVRVGMGP